MRCRAAYLRALVAACLISGPASSAMAAEEAPIALPSGLEAHLQETISDQPGSGLVYRFRFVAPAFTGQEDFEVQTADLEHLCNDYALPRIPKLGPKPDRIVISLADQSSEFGRFDPDVMQIFETFSLQSGTCILELF